MGDLKVILKESTDDPKRKFKTPGNDLYKRLERNISSPFSMADFRWFERPLRRCVEIDLWHRSEESLNPNGKFGFKGFLVDELKGEFIGDTKGFLKNDLRKLTMIQRGILNGLKMNYINDLKGIFLYHFL